MKGEENISKNEDYSVNSKEKTIENNELNNNDENNNKILNKIKQFVIKMILPIEFIISIFAIYSLYEIVVYKNMGIWSLKYILILVPTIILLITTIVINIKKNKERIEKIFIAFLIPVSMLYVFFVTPYNVPDEHAHTWKAYEISEGKIITQIQEDGTSLSEVPAFFGNTGVNELDKYGKVEEKKTEDTNYEEKTNVDNPAKAYPAVLYLFSATSLAISRLFSINGIIAIYFARIVNLIVFLICGYYSIKLIPFGKKVIGTILFLPMMLQQAASLSADSVLNSVSLLYVALTLYLMNREQKINWKNITVFVILSVIISISKITYYPLVAIALLFVSTKNLSKKAKKIFIPTLIAVCAIIAMGWYVFMQQYPPAVSAQKYTKENNVNMSAQIENIIEHPSIIYKVVRNSLITDKYMVQQLIGSNLGWLNIEVSSTYIIAFLVLLIASPFLDKNEIELKKWQKIWLFLITMGSYLLVFLALYLTWTPVGLEETLGVQGRYFLPILALPLLCLCKKDNYIKYKNVNVALPIILSVLNILVMSDIIAFFI